jgi:CRP-like cAMP-binding protein
MNAAAGLVALALVAAVLAVYAILVRGFSRDQKALIAKGAELAKNSRDVQQLIERQGVAFRRTVTALFPWRPEKEPPVASVPAQRMPPVVRRRATVTEPARATVPGPAAEPPQAAEPPSLPAPAADPGSGPGEPEPSRSGRQTFWDLLTPAERGALTAVAAERIFLTGKELCREGAAADHVLLIRSGWTKVSVQTGAGERIIARRGPGDLVGERAAMRTGSRSATITAEEIVRAYVLSTEDFLAFVRAHPRVLGLLNRQIYDRLTENRDGWSAAPAADQTVAARVVPAAREAPRAVRDTPPPPSSPGSPPLAGSSPARPLWTGQNCSIVFLDVTAFGARTRRDGDRQIIREVMYQVLQEALRRADVPPADCHWDDRGDGVLVIVPPGTPTDKVADALLIHLAAGLFRHNDRADGATGFQLRVALAVGPVVSDRKGVSGEAIIHAARLLDAPFLKRRLADTGADLGFIACEFVYNNVIRHRTGPAGDYQRVSFRGKESRVTGWMRLIGRQPETGLSSVGPSFSSSRSVDQPGAMNPSDILVVIAHPWADIEVTLAEWMATGPGPRPFVRPVGARSRTSGKRLPLTVIPFAYRNDEESRRAIADGLIDDPWA